MSHYWVKLYHEILNDPKMGRLPDRAWRRVIELFLLAGETGDDGQLPVIEDIAWRLRVPIDELKEDINALIVVDILRYDPHISKLYIVNFGIWGVGFDYARMPYKDYLATLWWRNRRAQMLRQTGYKCQLCGLNAHLHVHHKNYGRIGHEHDDDLMVLCRECHRKVHSGKIRDNA